MSDTSELIKACQDELAATGAIKQGRVSQLLEKADALFFEHAAMEAVVSSYQSMLKNSTARTTEVERQALALSIFIDKQDEALSYMYDHVGDILRVCQRAGAPRKMSERLTQWAKRYEEMEGAHGPECEFRDFKKKMTKLIVDEMIDLYSETILDAGHRNVDVVYVSDLKRLLENDDGPE